MTSQRHPSWPLVAYLPQLSRSVEQPWVGMREDLRPSESEFERYFVLCSQLAQGMIKHP